MTHRSFHAKSYAQDKIGGQSDGGNHRLFSPWGFDMVLGLLGIVVVLLCIVVSLSTGGSTCENKLLLETGEVSCQEWLQPHCLRNEYEQSPPGIKQASAKLIPTVLVHQGCIMGGPR